MSSPTNIATYLNDHLAGSVAALRLIESLQSSSEGTDLEDFFGQLYQEVEADQQTLVSIMQRLQIVQSPLKKATAWIAAKIAELKLGFDDRKAGELKMLEALEILALGIEGKHSLWKSLAAVTNGADSLAELDWDVLKVRASEQRERVEHQRLDAARNALHCSEHS